SSIHVSADEVSFHQVPRGSAAVDANTVAVIARDDVARGGYRAANHVVGSSVNVHAGKHKFVAQGRSAGNIRADKVALHQIAGRIAADSDTIETVWHGRAAGSICTEVVALDRRLCRV